MKYLIFLTIFTIAFSIYLFTMPPTVYWQDAGIFLTAIKTLGIPYPPGFPLYVMLGHLFTKIIPWGNFAQKVHAFSALWGAGAAGTMALIGWEIFRISNIKHQISNMKTPPRWLNGLLGGERSIAFISSLTIGLVTAFSYSLWAQSINAEVYSFHAFFTAAFLYFLILLWRKERSLRFEKENFPKNILVFLAIVTGLSFANHPLAVMFLLPIGYLIFLNWRLIISQWRFSLLLGLIFILCSALPYLYLPLRARMQPELNWGNPATLRDFIKHVIGSNYLTREKAFVFWNYERALSLVELFWEEFFLIPIVLGFGGVYFLFKNEKELVRILGLFGALVVFLAYFYTQGTEYSFWLIPFYLVFTISFVFGLRHLISLVQRKSLLFPVGLGVFVFSIAPLLIFNWPYLNHSNYYTAADFAKNILRPLNQDSILFILGDQPSSTVLYLQKVEKYREDVVMVPVGDFGLDHVRTSLCHNYPLLKWPPKTGDDLEQLLRQFVKLNLDSYSIYFLSLKSVPADFEYPFIPASAFWKVSIREDEVVEEKYWDFQFTDPNFVKRPMKKESQKKIVLANEEEGYQRLSYHDNLVEFIAQAYKNLGDWYFTREEYDKAAESYEKIFRYDEDFFHQEIFINLALSKIKIGKGDEGEKLLLTILEKDNQNAQVRFLLTLYYEGGGNYQKALRFYYSTLQLDPSFDLGEEILGRLKKESQEAVGSR